MLHEWPGVIRSSLQAKTGAAAASLGSERCQFGSLSKGKASPPDESSKAQITKKVEPEVKT